MNSSQTQKILADALRQANAEKAAARGKWSSASEVVAVLESMIEIASDSLPGSFVTHLSFWKYEVERIT